MNKPTQNLNKAIRDFCSQLRTFIPEFQELWEARKDLKNNPLSKALWDDIVNSKQTIALLKDEGLPVNQEQDEALSQKMKEMR